MWWDMHGMGWSMGLLYILVVLLLVLGIIALNTSLKDECVQ